jgi:hypothetical protein
MAKAISQRISLDGASDVERQLKSLGTTGEQAFAKLTAATEEANRKLAEGGGSAEQLGGGVLSAGEKMLAAAGIMGLLGTAAVKLGSALLSSAEDAAKNANAVADAATRSGQSLQAYQEQIAVLKKAGFSTAEAEQIVKRFGDAASKAYKDAAEGLKDMGVRFAPGIEGQKALNEQLARTGDVVSNISPARTAIDQLNNAISKSKGIFDTNTGAVTTNAEAWGRFLEAISAIQDPLVRNQVLTKLLGEELARLFNEKVVQGKTPLADFLEEFKREGGGLSDAQKQVAADFKKAMDDLGNIRANANRDSGLRIAEVITPLIEQLNKIIPVINTKIDDLISKATTPLTGSFSEAIKEEAPKVFTAFADVFRAIGEEGPKVFSAIGQEISAIFSGIWSGVVTGASSMWDQIVADAQAAVNRIVGFWETVKAAIRQASDAGNISGTGAAGESNPFAGATGGYVRGPGTGTSDSIFARLSNGEYVVRAAAVQRYGVGFLSRLNSMQLPKFNMGGLVNTFDNLASSLAIPRFAGGGLAVAGGGSMSNVTIQFPGLPDIVGLRGSSSVVDDLRKAASMAQIRSGGRKPSRFG